MECECIQEIHLIACSRVAATLQNRLISLQLLDCIGRRKISAALHTSQQHCIRALFTNKRTHPPTFLSKCKQTPCAFTCTYCAARAHSREVYAHSLTRTQSLATAKSHKIFYEARRLEPRVRMSAEHESTRCVSAPDARAAAAMNGNVIRKIITSSSKCYGSSSPGNPFAIDFPRSRRLIYAARCPCPDKFPVL
jgi:hypothetical protein